MAECSHFSLDILEASAMDNLSGPLWRLPQQQDDAGRGSGRRGRWLLLTGVQNGFGSWEFLFCYNVLYWRDITIQLGKYDKFGVKLLFIFTRYSCCYSSSHIQFVVMTAVSTVKCRRFVYVRRFSRGVFGVTPSALNARLHSDITGCISRRQTCWAPRTWVWAIRRCSESTTSCGRQRRLAARLDLSAASRRAPQAARRRWRRPRTPPRHPHPPSLHSG